MNLLKYVIDYPAERAITLSPVDAETIEPVALTGLAEESQYELRLLDSRRTLAEQQKKMIAQGYLPSAT